MGSADIAATLAFDDPIISASGSGDPVWATFFGFISAGILTWDSSTLPDVITLADGNVVSINFEEGVAVVRGDTVTVHATITNNGAPVPEPATMLLLGTGLAGARWRKKA